mmetsp:Transcript_22358/g.28216  ORF Transcript_22358/g.28216 Transcript_22358/m.28216 type:complete len:108 (-) Transcript_22358:1335-1658(-)
MMSENDEQKNNRRRAYAFLEQPVDGIFTSGNANPFKNIILPSLLLLAMISHHETYFVAFQMYLALNYRPNICNAHQFLQLFLLSIHLKIHLVVPYSCKQGLLYPPQL